TRPPSTPGSWPAAYGWPSSSPSAGPWRTSSSRSPAPAPTEWTDAMVLVELIKMARRPRTWVSLPALCGLPILVAVFLDITRLGPAPAEQPASLAAVLATGSLFPAAGLAIVLPLFLPVAVAVIGGDAIAGEASGGTLRYLLLRPVGRTKLLVAKLFSLIVFT